MYIPVIRPLSLFSTSFLLSKRSRNLSRPVTSTVLNAYRKPRDRPAVKPIISDDVMRHGKLGWCRGAACFLLLGPLDLDMTDSSSDAMRVLLFWTIAAVHF